MNAMSKIDFILNESFNIKTILSDLKNLSYDKFKKFLQKGFTDLIAMVKSEDKEEEFLDIINKYLKTNYTSIDDISKTSIKENVLNEDMKHYWDYFKGELFVSISIFLGLQIWFQLDKLLDGVSINDLNYKKIVVYGVLWIFMLTGKHIAMFRKWKKDNKEDWETEGKPKSFSI